MEENTKRGKYIFSVLFLICLLSFSVFNIFCQGSKLLEEVREDNLDWSNPKDAVSGIEEVMNEELLFRYPLIEGYGAIQLMMGKKEENAFANLKGKDGMLYDANFWNGFGDDQKELAVRTRRLQTQLKEEGTEMGVVLYPMKTPSKADSYYGLPYNDYTKVAGDFAAWIRYYKVPLLDLGNLGELCGLTQQEMFFRTDHHWTPEAAFQGYCRILEWMEQTFGISLDPDKKLCDLEQYNQITVPDYMLGSQGREAGRIFAGGAEDYTVIYPTKPGKYILKRGQPDAFRTYEGDFGEALLDLEEKGDGFEDNYSARAENVYLHNGVDEYVSIRNLEAESDKKILLLRDSYATPVGAFLAQSFEQVDMLWTLRIDEEELAAFLEENHYDYVILSLYSQNLSEGSFPFGTKK